MGLRRTLLLVLAAGLACGEPVENLSASREAIIHGAPDGEEHEGVALLVFRKTGKVDGVCTGTLVAPNLVLTARHCVSETDLKLLCRTDGTPYKGGAIGADRPPGDILVYTGQRAIGAANDAAAAAARGKALVVAEGGSLCDADVAFILLDRVVDAVVAPIRRDRGPSAGEALTAVGWGLTEGGALPKTRMQRRDVVVDAVGPRAVESSTSIGLGPSEFMVREATCAGDSGGPAFAASGAVVGVVSRGGNGSKDTEDPVASCLGDEVKGYYTHLARKGALLERAFELAGYAPRDEGLLPGRLVGAPCETHDDCSSTICLDQACRASCASGAACSGDGICAKRGEIEACVPPPAPAVLKEEAPAPPPPSQAKPAESSGCASAPGGPGASGIGLALAAAVVAVARRRSSGTRRRRRD